MFFFNKKKEATNVTAVEENVSTATEPVSLEKSSKALERHLVSLKKEKHIDLLSHRARVFVVMDISYSMNENYFNGYVQDVLTRLLPLGIKFDDNGELEVYVFNHMSHELPSMNIGNYKTYVKHILLPKFVPSGGTKYAPAILRTVDNYNDGSTYPAFGIFITDGDNEDRDATDAAIRKSSNFNIFYQFVGIGNDSKFKYLQKLDDLSGRKVDNTGFIKVSDFSKLTDDELYEKLLEQYLDWLKVMKLA